MRYKFVWPQTFSDAQPSILLFISLLIATVGFLQPTAGVTNASLPNECVKLNEVANAQEDASPSIMACISRLADHATLRLLPGEYHIRTPLIVSRPITIETAVSFPARSCRIADSNGCAVFILEEIPKQPLPAMMPIEIHAPDVTLRAIAVTGSNTRSAAWKRRVCLDNNTRPLGGGIRVRGSGFRLQNALIRNVNCYSALEIVGSAKHPSVFDNTIGPNGSHDIHLMWADGLTIHDASGALVERNFFLDNTDVQLALGGCRECIIKENIFRHSGVFVHASFAELLVHAWPNTSGNFTGSILSRNDIDCSKAKRCGFGIMIGGEPWYPSQTFGGTVSDNRIANALLALNVDLLTGPMKITNNRVSRSGGIANSDCGRKIWPAANISPSSLKFAQTDLKDFASVSTSKCIILRQP